jgi:hypothetical protein
LPNMTDRALKQQHHWKKLVKKNSASQVVVSRHN